MAFCNKSPSSGSGFPNRSHPGNQRYSTLNPSANEWKPLKHSRKLFMTFSNECPPISRSKVVSFFTMIYGDCVEHIFINGSRGKGAEFGSIRFRSSIYPILFLGNLEKKTEHIGGGTVCFKWYNH